MSAGRFLIVDESDTNSLFFHVCLKELGHEKIETASSGADALKIMESIQPNQSKKKNKSFLFQFK